MSFPPQTPARPVPGGFINTPAPQGGRIQQGGPVRQPNFGQPLGGRQPAGPNPNDGQPNPRSREVAPPAALQPVQRAARTINEVLQREASFPELDSYVKQGISSEYDIQRGTNEAAWAPFQQTKMYEIPERIYEQYNRAEVNTMMGLFAELNHAWVSIDNALYLWDYTNPNPELIGFEEQPHGITAVKLVKPRVGVFVKDIAYLLVVATTQEIILLGVSSKWETTTLGNRLETSGVRTVALYQTRMTLNIKGINVQVIEGSPATGRIFFSGSHDNQIHELTYQQEEKWFASRCGRINHTSPGYTAFVPAIWSGKTNEHVVQMRIDDSRRLLYTLSSNSTIRTFYMDGPETLQQCIEKKRQECLRDISHMISAQSNLLSPKTVVCSISPISAGESSKLHLMATTGTGVRIFLSATRGYGGFVSGAAPPQSMQVHHIKFPPSSEAGPPSQALTQSYNGAPQQIIAEINSMALAYTDKGLRFPPGLFFCFVQKSDSRDALFLAGPDTGRIAKEGRDLGAQTAGNKYYEQACWLPLGSRAEDIGMVTPPFAASNQPIGFGNELAVQYDEPLQEIAILTNTGVYIIRRRRLVDIFAAAIRNQGGDEGLENEVKKFIRNYGRPETTASALAVACGQGSDVTPGDTRVARVSSPETLEAARKCFIEFGGRPSLNENMVSEGPSQAIDNVRPSSRHEGLALYMGRLVRSIWKSSVITQKVPTEAGGLMTINTTISLKKLTTIQEDLQKLATFLEKNKTFIEGLSGSESLQRASSQQEEIAIQGEHQALHSLQKLNSSIIEGISFVQMLFDERVDEIWTTLDDVIKQRLRDLTYEILFSSEHGKDLAKVLVKAIVHRNIANGSNVVTVAAALQRRCGSFCSEEDVVIFKAQEQLKKASEVGANSDMGRKLLNESLKLFMDVAGNLPYENLQTAVEQFTGLQFYAGAINLALLVAQESDRGNRALSWMKENKPTDDARAPIYNFRKQCYDLVHRILLSVEEVMRTDPEIIDGRLTLLATKRNEAQTVVNDSNDELFHFDLYDWYLSQGKVEELLCTDSSFIVPFLTKSASTILERADLLWGFYVRRDRFYEAACVQLDLAKSEFPVLLKKRIEYLSRAKANAAAQSPGVGRQARQILLYEITELLDVANIQDELLHRLRGDSRLHAHRKEEVIAALDGQIVNLTDLYNQYADQGGYFDICLEIYEAADHRNEADIHATWQQLVDQTHQIVSEDPAATQAPWEAQITMLRDMSQRLSNSENTFSPQVLIPMLEIYAQTFQNGVGPRTWLPDLFITVGFPFETIVAVLQNMWYTNTYPFTGQRKRILADHMLYVLGQWYEDCVKTNTRLFGSDENAQDINELLEGLNAGGFTGDGEQVCADLRRKILRAFR